MRGKDRVDYDNRYTFDKVTAVALAGSAHEVDQPHHLVVADTHVCATTCIEEYGNPCESFCPAAVYEMIDDAAAPRGKPLFIHHENCVHCKTCDIADPYAIITWKTPEGGGGPDSTLMQGSIDRRGAPGGRSERALPLLPRLAGGAFVRPAGSAETRGRG